MAETKGGTRNGHEVPVPRCLTPKEPDPWEGEGGGSVERSLANMREAHQKALATVVALEEEIEWLSCPLTRNQLEVWVQSKSRDCWVHRSRGQMQRC